MITVRVGNLLESNVQTLVNTVNCVGVMGKGIALEFKKRFPKMFADYEERCRRGSVKLGEPYLYKDLVGQWVLNFPTKDHWRSVSRLKDIVAGLDYLKRHYQEWGITSLAAPPLGCGHGGLEWRVVGPTLYRHLSQLEIPVELFAPYGTRERELSPEFLSEIPADALVGPAAGVKTNIDPALVALVEIVARISSQRYHWPVGRTTFQKIAYFGTVSGLPTSLRFERGSYGPFSRELKPAITRLVNHALIEEQPLGRMFEIKPGPTFKDAQAVYRRQLDTWSEIIDRVADLFLRMQTKEAEIAATVHFAALEVDTDRNRKPTEREVFASVKEWKQRRRPPLRDEDVAVAVRGLNVLGWLDLEPSPEFDPKDEDLAYA